MRFWSPRRTVYQTARLLVAAKAQSVTSDRELGSFRGRYTRSCRIAPRAVLNHEQAVLVADESQVSVARGVARVRALLSRAPETRTAGVANRTRPAEFRTIVDHDAVVFTLHEEAAVAARLTRVARRRDTAVRLVFVSLALESSARCSERRAIEACDTAREVVAPLVDVFGAASVSGDVAARVVRRTRRAARWS
jgi:hypothetical protein